VTRVARQDLDDEWFAFYPVRRSDVITIDAGPERLLDCRVAAREIPCGVQVVRVNGTKVGAISSTEKTRFSAGETVTRRATFACVSSSRASTVVVGGFARSPVRQACASALSNSGSSMITSGVAPRKLSFYLGVSQNQALDCSELLFVKLAQYRRDRRGGGDSAAAIVAVSIGAKMPKAAFVARVTALHRCDGFISDKLPFCYQTEETVSALYQKSVWRMFSILP
jgi:hypothetical protein